MAFTKIDKIVSEILAMEAQQAKDAGALGFMARTLVQATLPHSKPEGLFFERKNGSVSVVIIGHPYAGLPYGSLPRLLMAWMTTEAVKTKEPTLVLGNTLSDFMEQLGLMPTGGRWGSITRLREQMKRLFSSSISCVYDQPKEQKWAEVGFRLVNEAKLWWNPNQPEQAGLWESQITLSPDFFQEIIDHPVPIDLRALKTIKQSPMAIDIYCWLTHRMSYLKKPVKIPWDVLRLQFGAEYGETKQGRYDFKRAFTEHLKKILCIYKTANLEEIDSGLLLKPGKPHIPMKLITNS
mgnify:CR=1 FL=1